MNSKVEMEIHNGQRKREVKGQQMTECVTHYSSTLNLDQIQKTGDFRRTPELCHKSLLTIGYCACWSDHNDGMLDLVRRLDRGSFGFIKMVSKSIIQGPSSAACIKSISKSSKVT